MKKKVLGIIICVFCLMCSACGESEIKVTDEVIDINYNSVAYKGRFSGTLINKVPSGEGVFKSDEGWMFEGEFEEGMFSDAGNVTDYPITITYQENDYDGFYTGETAAFLPNGEGKFISEKDDVKFSYTGKWVNGELSDAGELETNNYTMHFTDFDRIGYYLGETESGIPSGQGKFTATNSDGEDYTYTGEFKNGIFHGQGSRVFDESGEHYTEIGTFINGDFSPDLIGGINAYGSRDSFKFVIADETTEFINSNLQYIEGDGFEFADIEALVDRDVSYGDYIKQPSKYLSKMVCWENYTIIQIQIYDFYDKDQECIEIIAQDNNNHVICSYGFLQKNTESDKTWIDFLNEGAELDFYGIPISSTSFENVAGGNTNCVVMLTVFYDIH